MIKALALLKELSCLKSVCKFSQISSLTWSYYIVCLLTELTAYVKGVVENGENSTHNTSS